MGENLKRAAQLIAALKRIYWRIRSYRFPKPFPGSETYWEQRYAGGGNSGAGSYGELARFKAEVLNRFVRECDVSSVIEYGCGDGSQLTLAEYPAYLGFDISATAVDRCRELFRHDATKTFKLMTEYAGETADLTLSLDVIYHLVEDHVFAAYMVRLFVSSQRYVIVYSSNTGDNRGFKGSQVRHRMFTDWVSVQFPQWKRTGHVPNRYPYSRKLETGSFADFYFYEKTDVRHAVPARPCAIHGFASDTGQLADAEVLPPPSLRSDQLPGYLFVLPWDPRQPGGVDQVVINLFRQVAERRDFEPRMLISSWSNKQAAESLEDGRSTVRMRLRRPMGGRGKLLGILKWIGWLIPDAVRLNAWLRENQIAVVNVHFPSLAALQFVAVKMLLHRRLKILLSFHGMDLVQARASRGAERFLWSVLLRAVDCSVACSEALATEIRSFDPECARRIVSIRNGLDLEAFRAEREVNFHIASELSGRPFILSVAAFEEKKGLDILIRSFALLRDDGDPELRLVLIGIDRGHRHPLESLANELGVADQVLFLQDMTHSRLHSYYSAATVFCLPSRSEPFGLVLLEAGAFACAVVASRVGGIPEIISHGETGRLVAPEDVEALASELNELLSQPDERQRLGDALRDRVREQFTWRRAYEQYKRLTDLASRKLS